MPQEIEILRTGTHTSKSGAQLTVTEADLKDLVSSYDPANFQAPVIISHDTKGVADKELAKTKFAYGAPKFLRKVGDRVRAVFEDLPGEFKEWVRQKKLLAISPSLYLPNSPNNPSPGRLSLRHIAALGSEPPAIKGLAPMSATLSLSDFPDCCFSEGEEGTESLEFSASELDLQFGEGDRITARLFQGLRDWMIDRFDLEAADRALPGYEVGMLSQTNEDSFFNRMLSDLSERVSRLEMQTPSNPLYQETMEVETPTTTTVDLSDREAQLSAREQALYRKEFLSFCETELKGRLIPAIAPHAEVAEFMTWLANQEGEINFSEESKLQPLAWFKGFLSRLPQSVPMGQSVTGDFMEGKKGDEDEDPDKEAKSAYENAWKKGEK